MPDENWSYRIYFDAEATEQSKKDVHFKSFNTDKSTNPDESGSKGILTVQIERNKLVDIMNKTSRLSYIEKFYRASNSFLVPLVIGYAATGDSVAKDICQFTEDPYALAILNAAVDAAFLLAAIFALTRDNKDEYAKIEHGDAKTLFGRILYIAKNYSLLVLVLLIFMSHVIANILRNYSGEVCKNEKTAISIKLYANHL